MKKIIACFMALALLVLSGCTQKGGEETDQWGITLSAENVTPFGMVLVCEQSGGKFKGELQTGMPFVLEREVEGQWLPVSTITSDGDMVWTSQALWIRPNGTTKWTVDWEGIYGYLDPGPYRLSKEIMDFRGPGKYTNQTYYVEFGVED